VAESSFAVQIETRKYRAFVVLVQHVSEAGAFNVGTLLRYDNKSRSQVLHDAVRTVENMEFPRRPLLPACVNVPSVQSLLNRLRVGSGLAEGNRLSDGNSHLSAGLPSHPGPVGRDLSLAGEPYEIRIAIPLHHLGSGRLAGLYPSRAVLAQAKVPSNPANTPPS
jgi:hypothetical protein